MKTLKAITLVLVILMLAAPLLIVRPIHAAPAKPIYYSVKPSPVAPLVDINASPYGLETPPTPSPVGEHFYVEIHLENATLTNEPNGISGVQIDFYFGNILTYAVPVGFNNTCGTVGGVLNPPLLIMPGYEAMFYDDLNNQVPNYPYTGATHWKAPGIASMGGPWNGTDGIVVRIWFRIIYQPNGMLMEPTFYGDLALVYTDLVNGATPPVSIDHDRVQGQLAIDPSPYAYPARPYIFVEPAAKTGTMGEIFNVAIKINADPFWDVAGFDITFTYDPTLLSLVPGSVTEGNFLKQGGVPTWGWIDDTVAGRVWAVFIKLSNATTSGGTDTLITLQLQVIYEHDSYPPPTCDLGLENTALASWAHPERPIAPWEGRITSVELPFDPRTVPPAVEWSHYTIKGVYTAPYIVPGPAIDLYTQYNSPYGGQGPNEHSDAFAPQMWVILRAKVTYGGDRISNKLVTFEVHNALDQKITILYDKTDENGIAEVGYRIPQTDYPCGHDPAIFGWWWVIATVSIDEVMVNDTLTFQVGWLIEVVSVVANNDPYRKYIDPMNFTVTVQTISEQPRWGLVTVDAFDAEGYPIAEQYDFSWFNATRVQGDPHGTIPGVYTWTFTASIPTWARVGTGTVTAIALTDWPRNGGTAYCPAVSDLFGIKKS